VALTVVLLVGAGLFMRSFVNLTSVPLGFDPAGVLSGSIAPRADGNAVRPFGPRLGDFLRRLEQVPGVEAASAYAGTLPLYGYSFTSYGPRDRIRFSRQYVTPDYHRAMRIPLRRGRYLSPTDGADVVLINESAARSLSGDADPIGQVAAGGRRVVGVVGDVRLIPEGEVDPIAYVPFGEDLSSHDIYLAVRTAGAPMDVAPAVRAIAADVLPGLPIRGIRSLDAVLSGLTAQRRLSMQLLGLFGLLGIVIAVIGIYGIVSYVVSLRTKEIGLRIALGATRARILTLLLRGAFAVAGAGLLAGLVGAWWLGVRVEPFLFRLEPTDKAVFAAACVLLAVAAAAASVVPALRALRIDPVKTLRCE
jgi:putative ABC transport system permease protein